MIRAASDDDLKKLWSEAPIPVSKGKGAPYWFPGQDRESAIWLATLARSTRTLDELIDSVWRAASARVKPMLTAYLRIQASRKEVDRYILGQDGIRLEGTRFGPKVRKVQALPFVFNYMFTRVAWVMKWGMQTMSDRNTGTVDPALKASRTYKHTRAFDLSNYDDTVSWETLTVYRETVLYETLNALRERGLLQNWEVELLLTLDEYQQDLPLLTPPMNMDDGARLIPTHGGIKSGERLTSDKGTHINACRIEAKMAKHGVKGEYFNWGDDTVICSDDEDALKRYAEDSDYLGFKEVLAGEPSFLMKRLPSGTGYWGRMLSSSINKEIRHEPNNMTAAAAAICVRKELLKGHPLERHFLSVLGTFHPRVHSACRVAGNCQPLDLVNMVGRSVGRGATEDEVALGIAETALYGGLIDSDQYDSYLLTVGAYGARAYITASEMDFAISELTPEDATRAIRKRAYTTRPRK
jgi:hypothetical protein